MSPPKVAMLADVLRRGDSLEGRITFDDRARLVDGRHRLTAVVQSGVTTRLEVLAGWSCDLFGHAQAALLGAIADDESEAAEMLETMSRLHRFEAEELARLGVPRVPAPLPD